MPSDPRLTWVLFLAFLAVYVFLGYVIAYHVFGVVG